MYKCRLIPVGETYTQVDMLVRDRNITKEEVEILMNAEALVGTVLGTCTLQQVTGQGGMGAVYLAQQSRPRRQVAVKVLLPATALKPRHLAAFLERFRRETDAAASLEHPNIMPVYEYGEYDGLAYVVMPYVSGGTLRDVMERYSTLPLPRVLNYLEQMSAALDFAHARGVIHRDVKPANILLTLEGRLLLTDFGLVKVISEGQGAQARLTGAGAPVGTPDYMSPEQVMGGDVDRRADQYSLGIILYQMVTGTTPFQGETPMQIAAQQLHMQPASPRLLRPDLPAAAEQVILKAMAKRPEGRYRYAQDLATAFRMALQASEMQQQPAQNSAFASSGLTTSSINPPHGLFNRNWQTGALPSMTNEQHINMGTGALPIANAPTRSTGLLSRTGMFPSIGNGTGSLPTAPANDLNPATPDDELSTASGMQPVMHPQGISEMSPSLNAMTGSEIPASTGVQPTALPQGLSQMSPSLKTTTGALNVPDFSQTSPGTIKLTGPMKVIQVPVAGQPGQYITGLLPVSPDMQSPAPTRTDSKKLQKIALAVAMVIVLIGGITGVWLMRTHTNQSSPASKTSPGVVTTPDLRATMAAQATATAQANVILSDSLNQNIHNWPTGSSSTKMYVFKNGAYHITNLGNEGLAVILQETLPSGSIAYTLTMQEIKGDDNSINNSFGMILRYSQQTKGNQLISTFYSFEVVNTPGGEYRFYKYNNSKGSAANPWTQIWHQVYGHEFHDGHTPKSINTFRVFANGNTFTFTVNGKGVGSARDSSYRSGTVGMLVNLNGTEVAFSKMLITHH
jgi:serine/threonine protein kinase